MDTGDHPGGDPTEVWRGSVRSVGRPPDEAVGVYSTAPAVSCLAARSCLRGAVATGNVPRACGENEAGEGADLLRRRVGGTIGRPCRDHVGGERRHAGGQGHGRSVWFQHALCRECPGPLPLYARLGTRDGEHLLRVLAALAARDDLQDRADR